MISSSSPPTMARPSPIMSFPRFGRLPDSRETCGKNEAGVEEKAATNGICRLDHFEGSQTYVADVKRDALTKNNVDDSRCNDAKPEDYPDEKSNRGLGLGQALARLRLGRSPQCNDIRGSSTVGSDSSDQDEQNSRCDSHNQAVKSEEGTIKGFGRTSAMDFPESGLSHIPNASPAESDEDGAREGDGTITETDIEQIETDKDDKGNHVILGPVCDNFRFNCTADPNDIPIGDIECASSGQDVHQPNPEAFKSAGHPNERINRRFGLSSVFSNLLSGRANEKLMSSRQNESPKRRNDFSRGLTHLQCRERENVGDSDCSLDSQLTNDSGGWRARNDPDGVLHHLENESSNTVGARTVSSNNWMDPLLLSNRESNDLVGLCSMYSGVVDDEDLDDNDTDTIGCLNSVTKPKPQQPSSSSLRHSFAGSFMNVDGINRMDGVHRRESDIANTSSVSTNNAASVTSDSGSSLDRSVETRIQVASEDGWFAGDRSVRRAKAFEENVLPKITTLEESHMLLRRTQAVLTLASRLMAAPDEQACFEEASKLLVPLFKVDLASYGVLVDSEHFVLKNATVNNRQHARKFVQALGNRAIPLEESAAGYCAKTLKPIYTPRTKESPYPTQQLLYRVGLNTMFVAPILVNGNKFAGVIVVGMATEDGLNENDQTLMCDIAAMLGANIYSKRLKQSAEKSNKVSREMLHSMIPPKVIEKIECFWDKSSDEYGKRRSSLDCKGGDGRDLQRSTNSDVKSKISFLNQFNLPDDEYDDIGLVVDTSGMELGNTSRALYAENADNVVILFTDLVGFSRMSLTMQPIEVVDMLQDLFSRFDALCDLHGVQKLETIGDAYICTAGLLDDCAVEDAAKNVLNLAKDMVRASQEVLVPCKTKTFLDMPSYENLHIRVGIHVGNVTCGVLGQRLPKFTVFGNAVNLAARMEQTSQPDKIRVTTNFYEMVADVEGNEWEEFSTISVKNMGEVGTYLLKVL
mmetsp:Transcript_29057/g.60439  ORF Transcript_29057/g.60439 Transcript_29057/m.60439 type:complete len:978 (-) Transcript_29057:154-3087(-)